MEQSLKHNLIRIALVEALINASNCSQNSPCSCDFCAYLHLVGNQCGIDFEYQMTKELTHTRPDLITRENKYVLQFLSTQLHFRLYSRSNIFDGMMELPDELTSAYRFYEKNRQEPGQDHFALIRQTTFILVSAALPDSYLTAIQHKSLTEFLNLPKTITNDISHGQHWTSHFGEQGCLAPIAGYGLDFGFDGKESEQNRQINLSDYVNLWPDKPDFFAWWDRTNMAGTCGGLVVRTPGLLVSQQWAFPFPNDKYMQVFNEHIAPLLVGRPANNFDHVIVVFSSYRKQAYIASTDPRSWDTTAPHRKVLLPLPAGYGIVGNWKSMDSTYEAPNLRSFDSDAYTPRLRAAVRFLDECLEIDQAQRRRER